MVGANYDPWSFAGVLGRTSGSAFELPTLWVLMLLVGIETAVIAHYKDYYLSLEDEEEPIWLTWGEDFHWTSIMTVLAVVGNSLISSL